MIESLEPRVFLSGPFKQAVTVQTGMVSNVVVGDFDGNGSKDLATNGGVVLLNNGHGKFRRVPGVFSAKSIDETNAALTVAADFNRDGMDDIAGMFNGNFCVFFARGKGLFHLPIWSNQLSGPAVVLDANGDGYLDIALSNQYGIKILMNNGRNDFIRHSYPAPNVGAFGVVPGPIAAADFDGDGDVDLIGGTSWIRTPIYFNDGKGGFAKTGTLKVKNHGVIAADFNRDHKADLLVNNYVFLGNGNGTFNTGVVVPGELDAALGVGDFNGDRKLDLAFSSIHVDKPGVVILSGRGNGTFTQLAELQPKAGTKAGAIGDFNADGKSDLIAFNQPYGGMAADPVLHVGGGGYGGGWFFEGGEGGETIYQPDTVSILLT
jgi:hypothetical protein